MIMSIMTVMQIEPSNLTDLLGSGLIGSTFGSPILAGIFLLGLVAFFLFRYNVNLDGSIIVMTVTILLLSTSGIFSFGFLFIPIVMGLLGMIGLAIIKIFRR